jgi:predicted oxidoreductase (fatty acid repression mutant protein)
MMMPTRKRTVKEKRSSIYELDDKIATEVRHAADAVRDLVRSIPSTVEQKIAFEHQIDHLSREADYMLNEMDSIQKANRKKILFVYRKFLLQNIKGVDGKLKRLEKKK